MLKFDYPAVIGLYICDVLLAILGLVDNLLPIDREFILPRLVPFGFVFPPGVTHATSMMSPVPILDFATFRHHRTIASRADACKAGLGLSPLSVHDSNFHVQSP